jgi:hypothetical protein
VTNQGTDEISETTDLAALAPKRRVGFGLPEDKG